MRGAPLPPGQPRGHLGRAWGAVAAAVAHTWSEQGWFACGAGPGLEPREAARAGTADRAGAEDAGRRVPGDLPRP